MIPLSFTITNLPYRHHERLQPPSLPHSPTSQTRLSTHLCFCHLLCKGGRPRLFSPQRPWYLHPIPFRLLYPPRCPRHLLCQPSCSPLLPKLGNLPPVHRVRPCSRYHTTLCAPATHTTPYSQLGQDRLGRPKVTDCVRLDP